jgi:hypothetical protein
LEEAKKTHYRHYPLLAQEYEDFRIRYMGWALVSIDTLKLIYVTTALSLARERCAVVVPLTLPNPVIAKNPLITQPDSWDNGIPAAHSAIPFLCHGEYTCGLSPLNHHSLERF